MPPETLFHDEYTGPRFTYGMQNRPVGWGNTPPGWVIQSDATHPDFKTFGTIDYPFELTPEQIYSFELTPIKG